MNKSWDVPLVYAGTMDVSILTDSDDLYSDVLDVYTIDIPGMQTTFSCPSSFTKAEVQEWAHEKVQTYRKAMSKNLPVVQL